jgi:dienelactone hydrolase
MTTRRQIIKYAITGPMLLTLGCASDPRSNSKIAQPYSLRDLDWHDANRNRSVPVRLYLPNIDLSATKIPLIIFSHGIGGSRYGYSYLGRAWATNGFASLHLQHVGSDRKLWLSGSPFDIVNRLHKAARESEAIARAEDLRFALDQALSGELGDLIDRERVIAAGHSYGANTTLLAAGAKVERHGKLLDLLDTRIRAAIIISAPPFYGELSSKQILEPIQIPSLHITATNDVIEIPGYFSDAIDRIKIFEDVGSRDKMLAVFSGGSHSIFTDRSGTGGLTLNPKVKVATSKLTSAFLRRVLNGETDDLRNWPSDYNEILSRFETTIL